MLAAARENPNTLDDPAPSVFLDKFGDSSINFELVVWSREMSSRPRRYRSDLNFAIERQLRAAGIEIPNPQRDLHIRSGVLQVEQLDGRKETPGRPILYTTTLEFLKHFGLSDLSQLPDLEESAVAPADDAELRAA